MPTPPPRNAAGVVIPHDHDEIDGNDDVIRRISHQQVVTKGGRRRISSLAYKASTDPNGGMSVDLERFIRDAGVDPQQWVISPRWLGSVKLNVGQLRGMTLQVGYDPIEATDAGPANPYHGEVWGEFNRGQQTAIQHAAEWFVPIPGVELI